MSTITRADIDKAVKSVTGDPTTGAVADIQDQIVGAIDRLINGGTSKTGAREDRVLRAKETPEAK